MLRGVQNVTGGVDRRIIEAVLRLVYLFGGLKQLLGSVKAHLDHVAAHEFHLGRRDRTLDCGFVGHLSDDDARLGDCARVGVDGHARADDLGRRADHLLLRRFFQAQGELHRDDALLDQTLLDVVERVERKPCVLHHLLGDGNAIVPLDDGKRMLEGGVGAFPVRQGTLERAVRDQELAELVLYLAAGAALSGDVRGLEDDAGGRLLVRERHERLRQPEAIDDYLRLFAEFRNIAHVDVRGDGLDVLIGLQAVHGRLHPGVVEEVGAVVALRIRAAGTDVALVGIAEVLDQLVLHLQLHRLELVLARELRLLHHTHVRAHGLRLVEQLARVRERRPRAFSDLLEVGLRIVPRADRREVEGDCAGCEAKWVQPRVHLVHLLLNNGDLVGERGELRHGGPVDAAQPLVLEVDRHPALPFGDPLSALYPPEDRVVLLVRKGRPCRDRRVGNRTEIEREAVGKRRDEFALGVEVGVRARGAGPEPELPDLARVAVAAEGDDAAREIHREVGRERGGGDNAAVGVDENRLGRRSATSVFTPGCATPISTVASGSPAPTT